MGRAGVLEEIRIMRFEELLERRERGQLTQAEAGEMLGMSERSVRRWQVRYREEGAAGLVDRRVGQPSPRRAAESELARARALYAEMYDGFTVKHFHEKLVERHGYRLGYTVTRLALQASGQVRKAPRRGAHRRKRPRRPLPGMLLHQDAARHGWLAGRPPLDLVVTLDDATSRAYSAILVEEEGTASSFRALAEVVTDHGLFCALYTDRGSHYFHTPAAGGPVDRGHPTQVGRALAELGIEHVAAYSPQARGRSERAFRTLEDRLPKELALAGITDIDAANAWLRAVYLPAHNARFAVAAEAAGSAFVPAAPHQWREVLCLRETRQVGNDNCVRWRNRRLQIPKSPLRAHFVRATVRLHEYPDGAVALFWGPHRVADFAPPTSDAQDRAA
jgi:transposase